LKVLITGGGGLVGRAVSVYCASSGDRVFCYDHQSLDITNLEQVKQTLQQDRPEAVINCAAWTDVDGCELDRERAFAANAAGPENLAKASREIDSAFITISTDYVFNGEKDGFYTQRDQPCPESIYGLSKLEGERRAQLAYARSIVVRTGFVFGSGGTNFLSTVVERARRGEKLKAIRDAYGTPTYAPDLARRLRELAQLDLPGVFHAVNAGGGASFAEFTRACLDLGGYESAEVETVEMNSLKRAAARPRNSRLKCLLSEAVGLAPLPFWRDSLESFVVLDSPKEIAAKP
jgi:dTDP-4-dehydrorhamnose reductase